MTQQGPIEPDLSLTAGRWTDALVRDVPVYRERPHVLLFDAINTLFELKARCPRGEMAWLLDRALAELETDGPRVSLDDLRADAAFWADLASPREIEAYFLACLKRLQRYRTRLNPGAKKRLIVALWEVLAEDDRAAFLKRVDPDGAFRKP